LELHRRSFDPLSLPALVDEWAGELSTGSGYDVLADMTYI
jgi:hypothetical protein